MADHARFRSYYTQVLIKKLLILKLQPGIILQWVFVNLGTGIYFLHIIKKDMRIVAVSDTVSYINLLNPDVYNYFFFLK